MDTVIPDRKPRYDVTQRPNFTITGDHYEAYIFLKDMFDPKVESTSGGIKPLTAQEKLSDQNKVLAEILQTLPPTTIV